MVGVSPEGMGDSDTDRATGLRTVGSLAPLEPGVATDEFDRAVLGVLLAYGLGVVRESGLKLWPVSTSDAFVEDFHTGREGTVDVGRGIFAAGVLALFGVARRDRRAMFGLRGPCAGVGRDE